MREVAYEEYRKELALAKEQLPEDLFILNQNTINTMYLS